MAPSQVTERLQEGPAAEVLEHLYWPRLQAEFVSTFPYMTAVNKAHVLMLVRQEILQPEAARQILQAIVALEREGAEALSLDPRLEDAFFNYEAAVIRMTGPEIGGQMHTGRSRNDLSATLLRLQLRDRLLDLLPLFFTLRRTALAQAERYAEVIMPGYTHWQPAQPIYVRALSGGHRGGIRARYAAPGGGLPPAQPIPPGGRSPGGHDVPPGS